MSVPLPSFAGIPGICYPSGCSKECRHPHLTQVTATRLANSGIDVALVREVLDDERSSHGEKPGPLILGERGKLILASWGASPEEVEQITGVTGGPVQPQDDYYEKAKQRAARSRGRRSPEEQRERDRANAAAYRDRKRRERKE